MIYAFFEALTCALQRYLMSACHARPQVCGLLNKERETIKVLQTRKFEGLFLKKANLIANQTYAFFVSLEMCFLGNS